MGRDSEKVKGTETKRGRDIIRGRQEHTEKTEAETEKRETHREPAPHIHTVQKKVRITE